MEEEEGSLREFASKNAVFEAAGFSAVVKDETTRALHQPHSELLEDDVVRL
jgi:hypothetical protein